MAIEWALYGGLFLSAFLAATVFPAQSEVVLAALLVMHQQSWGALVVVSTVGNVLGSITSWWLGRTLLQWQNKTWFPFSAEALVRGEAFYKSYGLSALLFSWVPLVGDALCVAAGALGVKLMPFVVIVTIGKLARYLFVAAVVLNLI